MKGALFFQEVLFLFFEMIISSTVTHFLVKPCYREATLSVKVPFSSADPVYKIILRLILSGYTFLDLLKPCLI